MMMRIVDKNKKIRLSTYCYGDVELTYIEGKFIWCLMVITADSLYLPKNSISPGKNGKMNIIGIDIVED